MATWLGRWAPLALVVFSSCTPAPLPTTRRRPPPPPELAPEPAPRARPQKPLPPAMRAIPADAKMVGYVDFGELRHWPGADAADFLLDLYLREVHEASDETLACVRSALNRHPTIAIGSRILAATGRLNDLFVAAELDEHEPEQVVSCLRDANRDAWVEPLEGLPTVSDGNGESSNAAVALPRLLVIGERVDVRAAIAAARGPNEPNGIKPALVLDRNAVASFVADETPPFARAAGVAHREGSTLSGAVSMAFDDFVLVEKTEEELRIRALEGLTELTPLLGAAHPFVEALRDIRFQQAGANLLVKTKLTGRRGMKDELITKLREREAREREQRAQNNRRYEAENAVGAISRAAQAAYESASPHALCATAIDIPKEVPKATSYTPSQQAGADFDSGSATEGWRCLRFSFRMPIHYRYAYRRGGNYKGPARGGPDPGPNGFEVSAEGDVDGDGKTSFFSIVGTIDPKTGELTRKPMFMDTPFE